MYNSLAAAAALAFLASPAAAQPRPATDLTAPLPPIMPWHGASERLVVGSSDPWITPIEATNFEAHTHHPQETGCKRHPTRKPPSLRLGIS